MGRLCRVPAVASDAVYQTEYARASVLGNEATAEEFVTVDDDVPTSAILSPEEIAEELNHNKNEEEDEEETKHTEEEEERPVRAREWLCYLRSASFVEWIFKRTF